MAVADGRLLSFGICGTSIMWIVWPGCFMLHLGKGVCPHIVTTRDDFKAKFFLSFSSVTTQG